MFGIMSNNDNASHHKVQQKVTKTCNTDTEPIGGFELYRVTPDFSPRSMFNQRTPLSMPFINQQGTV